ncbi:MAG: hypothetical protein ACJATT_001533 [Myxococcota bacterium]|jgi:hypothetical protein
MNTQTHAIFNLAVLGTARRPELILPILVGGVLPDICMFGFYAVQKILGTPEATIWGLSYFQPRWQAFFNAFNSFPLITALLLVAVVANWPRVTALLASMELHCLGDIFLHHDDGHGHFWPLSSWHFESPVSYWDPEHYGLFWIPIELVLYAGCLAVLWRRHPSRRARVGVGLAAAIPPMFITFVLTVWLIQ